MKLTLKHALAAILLMLSSAAPVAAGPGEDAVAAYARGDYATALRLLRPLAEQGDAQAQYNLGVLYDNGQGVPQDDAEAVKWYRKAAGQGEARSQNNLANMYATGQGVPQNYAEAVNWFRKAAVQGNAPSQFSLGLFYRRRRTMPRR
jgi:TPR repeat protein